MELIEENVEERVYTYKAKIELTTGGDYGYTFRVMPKHEMLLDSENLNLVKWITKQFFKDVWGRSNFIPKRFIICK